MMRVRKGGPAADANGVFDCFPDLVLPRMDGEKRGEVIGRVEKRR